MVTRPLPIFDASSEFHQNLGLLKVADMAMRKHGDFVTIRASDVREMVLLTNTDCVRYWKSNQGRFQTELGEIASNAAITRMLLGDHLEQSENAAIWDATRTYLVEVNAGWDAWAHDALVEATKALVSEIPTNNKPIDLRDPCRMWSIRALCPVLFGKALSDREMADGLMRIEEFYFAMSTKDAEETADPEALPEFQIARAFLDAAVIAGLDNMHPDDPTVLAKINRAVPEDATLEDRIACLRPTLGRMLLEKLNIDGLGLFWTLTHLARDPELTNAVAAELEGRDIFGLPDAETPLTFSVVREGQRMYPELPFIYRITSKDLTIGDHMIPARTTILFAPWLVHRDARYWDEPAKFNGYRFLEPLKDASSYFPFGIGPRVRARTTFLQHQLSVAVRAVVQHTRFTLAPDCKRGNLRPILRSTLAPRGPVEVQFETRSDVPTPVLEDQAV